MIYKHLFGPIPSRRLGISLGIDLVKQKTCNLNCIYCEAGRTTNLTCEIKEYVPTEEIIEEIDNFLQTKPVLDFVTFSGAGEPTLHKNFGDIAFYIKEKYPQYKLALITNGTLFYINEIRKKAKIFDIVLPSLDAATQETFEKINRNHKDLKIEQIIDGLINFRKEYNGEIWLEIFIVPGINDNESDLQEIKKAVQKINPDKIQINSIDRPGVEHWIKPLNDITIERIKNIFLPLEVEFIGKYVNKETHFIYKEELENYILESIIRRPLTMEDIVNITGKHINEISKYIKKLIENGKIKTIEENDKIFYIVNK